MSDLDQSQQRNRWTLILVTLNFVMFLILFSGLGYLVWRSTALIVRLESNLAQAEQQIAQVQQRLQALDIDRLMGDLVQNTKASMAKTIQATVEETGFTSSVQQMAQRIDNTQTRLEQLGESVRSMSDRLQKLDSEHLAQQVSYQILKNLGDGFTNAARSRRQPEDSPPLQAEPPEVGAAPDL